MSVPQPLLEEYLRVINHKDSEITRLLRENEALSLQLRRKEDTYRSKLLSIRNELERAQVELSRNAKADVVSREEHARTARENEALKDDVVVLRDAVQKLEDELRVVTRTASKAQKHEAHAREKLEAEFRRTRTALEEKLFESVQRCGMLEATVASGGAKATDSEKELARWKVEAQRLQHEHTDQQRIIKELKRRCREMVPRESAEAEAAQLEDRYRTASVAMDKECARLRDQLREETLRAQRLEILHSDAKKRSEDLDQELVVSRRQFEEIHVAFTQAKVHHASTVDDLKRDFAAEARTLREQLEKERYARIGLEGEAQTLRQRLHDAERQASETTTKALAEFHGARDEVNALQKKLSHALMELEGVRLHASQQEELVRVTRSKSEHHRAESDIELSKVKSQLLNTEDALSRKESELAQALLQLTDCRSAVASLQADVSAERAAAHRREQEWRQRMDLLEEQLRAKEDEKRAAVESGEERLRAVERAALEEKGQLSRQTQRQLTASATQSQEHLDRIVSLERLIAELRNELAVTKDELAVRCEKERSLQRALSQQDDDSTRTKLELSDRDAAIQTYRRNLEQVSSSLRGTQEELRLCREQLEGERTQSALWREQFEAGQLLLAKKDHEIANVTTRWKETEQSSTGTATELQREVASLRQSTARLTSDLAASQQQTQALKAELQRVSKEANDAAAEVQREVIAPLKLKLDSLAGSNHKLVREAAEREERLADVGKQTGKLQETILFLQSECSSKERKLLAAAEELENHQHQLISLRKTQQQLAAAQEEGRRQRQEVDSLAGKLEQMEKLVAKRDDELSRMHDRELELLSEVSQRKSELATFRERLANLESLKAISDQNVVELQQRERDLLDKMEDLRSAQNMMQLCFDKQQEQLELSRRLKSDSQSRSAAPVDSSISKPLF